jgi:predicted P-loop ATPase
MSAEPLASTDWLPGPAAEAPDSIAQGWKTRLLTTSRGKAAACLENALVALRHAPEWQGVLHFDESALHVVAKAAPPWDSRAAPFAWRDDDDVRVAAWMQRQGIMVSKEIAGQAVQTIARELPFHPIREYLNGLVWDKIPRIND